MTANGLSSYELIVKRLTCSRQKLEFPSFLALFGKEVTLFYEKVCFDFVHFWSTFEGTLFFGDADMFWTHAVIF